MIKRSLKAGWRWSGISHQQDVDDVDDVEMRWAWERDLLQKDKPLLL